ncbi:MAG TPA: hypothetical protein PLZ11_13680 [Thauera sp.]|nr:hypothetical protein [Thauera sp.]
MTDMFFMAGEEAEACTTYRVAELLRRIVIDPLVAYGVAMDSLFEAAEQHRFLLAGALPSEL